MHVSHTVWVFTANFHAHDMHIRVMEL
jgi:hypothetical protein